MFTLTVAMLLAPAEPAIQVSREADHYRLAVGFFRWSEGEAVNTAIEELMKSTCGTKAVQRMELDFQTVDPGGISETEPPPERAVWNYWATFQCVERPAPGRIGGH